MSYIDVTGKTEDEALRKGLEQLGMDRDDVSVSILERAKSGFLGIGASPARIRITYGPEEAEVAAPAEVKIIPEEKPAAPVQPAPAKAEEPAAARSDKYRTDKPRTDKPRPQRRPEQSDRPRPERRERPAPAAPAIDLPECDDDNAKRIIAFVSGLIACLDMQIYKIICLQSFDCRLRLTFIIGVSKTCRSFHDDVTETGIMTDTANQIDCRDDRASLDLRIHL